MRWQILGVFKRYIPIGGGAMSAEMMEALNRVKRGKTKN